MQEALVFKKRFDPVLGRFLEKKIQEVKKTTNDPFVHEVVKHARTLVMAGGKRVRPFLAFLSYRAAGGKKDILETLVGLELFHAFALVHDDIMDRGMERHGVATTHRLYGDAQAILLGDLLFEWANALIAPTKGQVIFSRMVQEVILGQMLDVDAIRRKKVSDQFIQDKMRLKTASYTFIRPLQFGAALAGKPGMYKFCEKFGLPLGLAFQIQDDLLDLTASTDKLGKSAFNDIREGQKTVFTQFVAKKTKHDLSKYKGKALSEKDKERIRKILEESGALEHGRNKMAAYFREAELAVEHSGMTDKQCVPFVETIEYIRSRSS